MRAWVSTLAVFSPLDGEIFRVDDLWLDSLSGERPNAAGESRLRW